MIVMMIDDEVVVVDRLMHKVYGTRHHWSEYYDNVTSICNHGNDDALEHL